MIVNIVRNIYHSTGAILYCSSSWTTFFQPLFKTTATSTALSKLALEIFTYSSYGLFTVQSTQIYLGLAAGNSLLFGLYIGEVMGTAYMYLAQIFGFQLMK